MNIHLFIGEICVRVHAINTEVDEKVKLGEVGLIFRTTRSCFMRSKRGGHGWPLTEMTMQIGRSAIGFYMSHKITFVTDVNNTGNIYIFIF